MTGDPITSFLGSASFGLAFPSVTLSETQLATADESFIELAGTMLYHEFGHHFLWHMLKGARQQALCYFQGICLPTGPNESRADAVAGELGRKAGYSVGLMRMTYDLLAYYAAIRSNSFLTWSTVQSSTFQFAVSDSRYPSIGTRKEILRSAWIRF